MNAREGFTLGVARCLAVVVVWGLPLLVSAKELSLRNSQMVVTLNRQDGSYIVRSTPDGRLILRSGVAAQIDHHWLKSADYPKHETSSSVFEDRLGRGRQISIRSTGLAQSPDLVCILRQYDGLPFTDLA